MLCEEQNLTASDVQLQNKIPEYTDLLFNLSIPPMGLGVIFNILCMSYFLLYQRKSLGDKLIIGLNFADLMTCILAPLFVKFHVNIALDDFRMVNFLFLPMMVAFTLTLIFTGLLWLFRMFGILRPLNPLNPKKVTVFVIFIIVFCFAAQVYFLQTTVQDFWGNLFCGEFSVSSSETIQMYANIGHLFVIAAMLLVFVVVTVKAVKKLQNEVAVDERSRADKRTAAVTVSIIVFIPFVAAIPFGVLMLYTSITYTHTGSDITKDDEILWEADFETYKLYLMLIIVSVVTSAINPCVYICRNRKLKGWLKGLWQRYVLSKF